ncbi:hypothetical protein EOD40_15660, partial [Flavobacterium sufflavum]
MKTKLLFLFTFFLFVGNIYSQFSSDYPDLRLDGFNCTANNVSVENVYLSAEVNGIPLENFVPTCTPGVDKYNVTIWMNYTQNQANDVSTTRLFATLSIGGVSTEINKYIGTLPSTKNKPAGKIQITTIPIEWTCGQSLSFTNILVVWEAKNIVDGTTPYTASNYTKSQCEFGQSTIFGAPLAVQFTYKACKVGINNTVNFTSTTNGGTAPYTYAWDFDNNGITDSSLANPTYIYTTSNNTAKLKVTDFKGVSNTYSVIINTPLELTLTGSSTNTSCNGGNTGSVSVTATGGTGTYTYSWKNASNTVVGTTSTVSNLAAGTYTVTVTDTNSCTSTTNVIVSPSSIPTAPTSGGNQIVCATSPIQTLTATATSTGTITWYTDSTGGTAVANPTLNTVGTVTYYAQASNGTCSSTTRTPVTLTINPLPTINITGTLTACLTTTLTANTNAVSPSYVWYKNDAIINGQTTNTLVVTTNGDYKVKVKNGITLCEQTSAPSTVSVEDKTAPVKPTLVDVTINGCSGTPVAPTTTDACAGTITGTTTTVFPISTQGTTVVTWTFNDGNGNTETATQNVIVDDVTKPAKPILADVNGECSATAT